MNTVGKVVDASVLVGSVLVGIGAVKGIISGVQDKKTSTILLGSLTLLIGVYAFKQAFTKIND